METETTTETPVPFGGKATKLSLDGGKEQFVIQTREHGEWYLRKLANLEAELERIEAQAATMRRQVESERNSHVSRYESQFQNLLRSELEKTNGKRKSLVFFNGTAGFRTTPARLTVESVEDALTTARAVAPQTVTEETPAPVVKLDKKGFLEYASAYFEETGEVLPALVRVPESESFSIKFPKKGAETAGEEQGDA